MGNNSAKPLTKEDLDAALQPIKDDLKAIKGALLVPEGDSRQDNNIVKDATTYYLISAAHVLVYFKPNETIELHNQSQKVLTARVEQFYLPRSYVKHGTVDIAVFSLREVNNISEDTKMVEFKFGLPNVGKGAVAHGKAFLRGTVTMIQESNLFTVLAHSVPGSSGSPLFDDDERLVGLVHGSSKHRGKHANGESEDASVVYCYSLFNCKLLSVHWDDITQGRLESAEDVPLRLANGSQELSDFLKPGTEGKSLKKLAEGIKYAIDKDSSLVGLMEKLAETIWGSTAPEQQFQILSGWKMATWQSREQ